MSVDITEYDTGLKLLSEPSDTDAYDPKSMLEYADHGLLAQPRRITNRMTRIIAIYGIGAHPLKTWCKTVRDGETNRVANWLTDRDMLGKEIPNARVWTFGYQSRWFGSDTIRTTVTDIVRRLLTALSQKVFPSPPDPARSSKLMLVRELSESPYSFYHALFWWSGCPEGMHDSTLSVSS